MAQSGTGDIKRRLLLNCSNYFTAVNISSKTHTKRTILGNNIIKLKLLFVEDCKDLKFVVTRLSFVVDYFLEFPVLKGIQETDNVVVFVRCLFLY